jgi:peptidoglycan hydrolase-like protein with peptidoglycan-binding domain
MKKILISSLLASASVVFFSLKTVNAAVTGDKVRQMVPQGVLFSATATSPTSTSSYADRARSVAGVVEKTTYQQYYGSAVQQSRSRVTEEEALKLCNARVSLIKEKSAKGLKSYSDVSKVKCVWGTKQIYPPVVSKASKKGAPQVLGASTSNIPCIDGPRNMHRANEERIARRVQSFLVQKGFLDEADVVSGGAYGEKTITAIKAYQSSVGVPATGELFDIAHDVMPLGGCR